MCFNSWDYYSFYLGTAAVADFKYPDKDDQTGNHTQGSKNWTSFLFCKYCTMPFTDESLFRQHIFRVHRKNYLAVCKDCGKVFYSSNGFNDHIKLAHGNSNSEDVFQCSICGKYFPRESRLRTHLKSHSSETHFTCPLCNKSYKHKFNLKDHVCKQNK